MLGSLRHGKGLLSRLLLGGFRVDFGLVGLGLICNKCAAESLGLAGLASVCTRDKPLTS